MERLVVTNCVNFNREEVDIKKYPRTCHFLMLDFDCPTLESSLERPIKVKVQTDAGGNTTAFCQETNLCKDLQNP